MRREKELVINVHARHSMTESHESHAYCKSRRRGDANLLTEDRIPMQHAMYGAFVVM